MKRHYLDTMKKYFRVQLLQTRQALGLTQARMASKPFIADRSYAALENGESCCGALTLVLFLLYCCKDPTGFLENLRKEIDNVDKTQRDGLKGTGT